MMLRTAQTAVREIIAETLTFSLIVVNELYAKVAQTVILPAGVLHLR